MDNKLVQSIPYPDGYQQEEHYVIKQELFNPKGELLCTDIVTIPKAQAIQIMKQYLSEQMRP